MPKSAIHLDSLVRGRVRTSFNKHNLFNLYKKQKPFFKNMTLYQQKWASKQEARAYHGEHLTENRWQSIFQPKLEGVAQLDASLKGTNVETPMVLQTFAALEKRLDYVIFRSMFASSVRQARKFILTQHVKVNGVVIKHPGFTLKPGDVFSVTPEKVLEALGQQKPSLKQAYKVDREQVFKWQNFVNEAKANPERMWERQKEKRSRLNNLYKDKFNADIMKRDSLNGQSQRNRLNSLTSNNTKIQQLKSEQAGVSRNSILKDILSIGFKNSSETVEQSIFEPKYGKAIAEKAFVVFDQLSSNKALKEDPKSEKFLEEVNQILPTFKDGKATGSFYDDSKFKKIRQLLSEINSMYLEKLRKDSQDKPLSESEIIKYWAESLEKHPDIPKSFAEVEQSERQSYYLRLPWQTGPFGLHDPKKPYFTPWKPRQFLAPFAVLPKHLELSFETCHGVYLRDPVARPGESEVISPFGEDIHERAYMFYVRKGM